MIAQNIQWCVTVIHNASIRAKQKKQRFDRDILIGTLPETLSQSEITPFYDDIKSIELTELLNSLSKNESKILYFIFILDLTQKEVAQRLNISQQQVSRIKRRALNSLRTEVA